MITGYFESSARDRARDRVEGVRDAMPLG